MTSIRFLRELRSQVQLPPQKTRRRGECRKSQLSRPYWEQKQLEPVTDRNMLMAIDELLETECGLGFQNPWRPRLGGREDMPLWVLHPKTPLGSQGEDSRKIPSCFQQREGKMTLLKCAQSIFHNKGLPHKRNYFTRALSDLI